MNLKTSNVQNLLDIRNLMREIVFGVEDGMVSTLGTVTGIAVGSGDRYTILLAGIVIIAVESISMGIGSYISNLASKEVEGKIVDQEKSLLKNFPEQERRELYLMFLRDGWAKRLAFKMAKSASLNRRLMLKEHEYRELGIFPYQSQNPVRNALSMFASYVIGGLLPLISYFLLPVSESVYVSVAITLTGLFILGAATTFFTNVKPAKAGIRLLIMGGLAFFVGLAVGESVSILK